MRNFKEDRIENTFTIQVTSNIKASLSKSIVQENFCLFFVFVGEGGFFDNNLLWYLKWMMLIQQTKVVCLSKSETGRTLLQVTFGNKNLAKVNTFVYCHVFRCICYLWYTIWMSWILPILRTRSLFIVWFCLSLSCSNYEFGNVKPNVAMLRNKTNFIICKNVHFLVL